MSIYNDFDGKFTYGKDMFGGSIIDDFSILVVDSNTTVNHGSTLGSGTNDLGKDTGAYTNLMSGQAVEAFGLFSKSTESGNIAANNRGYNCDHKSCVEDELLSYHDIEERVMITLVLNVTLVCMRKNLSGKWDEF